MLTPTRGYTQYDELIQEDPEFGFRIKHHLYKDEEIFQEEMDRIFYKGWVYIGHETEIPNPNDFVARVMGQRPVILCRGEDNEIRVLENKCRHRGNTVCQEQRGNSKFFRCAYHGWIYSNTGGLAEMTHPSAYGDRLPAEGELDLLEAPRIGVHRGFIFASLAAEGQPFEEYLGRAADYIDRYCDLAPDREIDLSAGRHGVSYEGNWKMQMENLTDAYHAEFTHATALAAFAANSSAGKGKFSDRGDLEDEISTMRDLGGGHVVLDGFELNRAQGENLQFTGSTGTLTEEIVGKIAEREGSREKAVWLTHGGGSHITVFPNLMILWDAVRTIQPVSLHKTVIYYHPAQLKGASQEINTARIMAHQAGFGPAGFLAPDDMEMFERTQAGTISDTDPWVYLNRGLSTQRVEKDDFGVEAITSQYLGETTQRGVWRHYKKIMSGE